MSGADVLLVIASVIRMLDGSPVIDRGRLAGLQPDDTGMVFYEVRVDGESRRIDVGSARVASVSDTSAIIAGPEGTRLGNQHRIEFRVPVERVAWHSILAATPAAERQPLVESLLDQHLAGDPELAETIVAALAKQETLRLSIDAGTYQIGLATDQAERYDQQPAFRIDLEAFAIDREIRPETAGLPYAAAAAICAESGLRLPAEFEWEVASREPGFDRDSGFYEWTSSPYRPYPGNQHEEPAYEEDNLVLRGDPEADELTPYRRRFLQPTVAHEKVAARCVRDLG